MGWGKENIWNAFGDIPAALKDGFEFLFVSNLDSFLSILFCSEAEPSNVFGFVRFD